MISKEMHHLTSGLHVLYVEDSMTIRNATLKLLVPYFNHIETAENGEEAFEKYKSFLDLNHRRYDIVITDLEMPKMDGKALSDAVLSFDSGQEVVVISAQGNLNTLIDLLNIGVKKFLSKPIEPDQLEQVIYEISQNIRHKRLKEEELKEISENNALLKKREELYMISLKKNLKELEEFNETLNESGIVSKTDPTGMITYVNDKFCEVSGYTKEELIGKRHSVVGSGDMASSFFEKLWRTITAQKTYKGIFKNRTKHGKIFYIEQIIKPILNLKGEIKEFIAIGNNITQMMHSIEIAKKAEEAKDDFFRNISHEMRTPLNSILGLTSLLRRRAKDDPKLLEMVSIIDENSQNLSRMIESVLDLQRINHNQLTLEVKEFDTSLFYNNCIGSVSQKAQAREITFTPSYSSSLPDVLMGDRARIEQVITILLDNAIKFTPKKGSVDMRLDYDLDHSILMCQIHDTGVGINESDHEKIFSLSQADGSTTREHEGAGLGLTIAKAIVDQMKGTITLHSVIGSGSTFFIELPLPKG